MKHAKRELSESVQLEIETSVNHYNRWWRIYGNSASMITILSILSSFAAGICAATNVIDNKFWAAILAGVPALLLTFDQSFKFRARSDWFWNLVLQYQALQRAMQRGDLADVDASLKIDEIESNANIIDPSLAKPPNAFRPKKINILM